MAYISSEEVKLIRDRIKAAFPKYKFSITQEHHLSVNVTLLESDLVFPNEYEQVNPYYIREHYSGRSREFWLKIKEIIAGVKQQEDRNFGDPYADYPDCNFYIHLQVGRWDKPHRRITP